MAAAQDEAAVKDIICASIRGVPNFPKPGILFWDVTTILLDPAAFKGCIDLFAKRYRAMGGVDVIAGACMRCWVAIGAPLSNQDAPARRRGRLCLPLLPCGWPTVRDGDTLSRAVAPWCAGFEARGLIFGAPLALELGVPFVPLRKPGKLPGEAAPAWKGPGSTRTGISRGRLPGTSSAVE